jgi:hypothetical protein
LRAGRLSLVDSPCRQPRDVHSALGRAARILDGLEERAQLTSR